MLAVSSMPGVARMTAQVACAVGIGVWAAILWAPAPKMPPALLAPSAAADSGTVLVGSWFGGAQTQVKIEVLGLIANADGYGAALLSVDGAPPRAYRAGDELASGVILHRVTAGGVTVAQDGDRRDVAAPVDQRRVPEGISLVDGVAGAAR